METVSNQVIAKIANATIKAADGKDKTKYRNGDTGDIIKETLDCYRDCVDDVKDFAPSLKSIDLYHTCFNVWQFVKYNIYYKEDPRNVQWVRTPARLWNDKEGDCKSFSVSAACILHQLGINGVLRFVSYSIDPTPTHVYVVVPVAGGEIYIDAVLGSFNVQKPYLFKQDYPMTQISRLSGVGNTTTVAPANAIQRLVFEREVERKNGTLTASRDQRYTYLISSLRNGGSISGIGDAGTVVSSVSSLFGPIGAAAGNILASIIGGGGPNPNDWKGWSPTGADARHWVVTPGDNVPNEAVNILSWIQANGIAKMYDSTNGVSAVTNQQIAAKLIAGGFPQQAQTFLNAATPTPGTVLPGGGIVPPAPTQSGMNIWLIGGVALAAVYFITKK